MTDFERELREMIRDVVREELARDRETRSPRAEFVSTTTAARIADVTAHTVRRWIREGRLVAHGTGGRLRVRRSDVERLLGEGASGGDLTPEQMARRDFG